MTLFFSCVPKQFDLWQDPTDAGLVAEAKKFAEENSDKKVGGPMRKRRNGRQG